MRLLVISTLFPPDILGGAEMSAWNIAKAFAARGWEVGVYTSAKSKEDAVDGEFIDGLRIWRIFVPRPYPILSYQNAKLWQKIVWHLSDHFHPRNKYNLARVLDEFQPDYVNIHVLQGLGFNILGEIGKRGLTATMFLHDVGLACIKSTMFKNGRECQSPCSLCYVSLKYKISQLRKIQNLKFVSPSRANLNRLKTWVPIDNYKNAALLNPNNYPDSQVSRSKNSGVLRLLYVGQITKTKGIRVLLQALAKIEERYNFTLTIIGRGPDENDLREIYRDKEWLIFAGFLNQTDISNHMANSDLLCVPSIWFENSPGVLIHALSQGLPALGSNKGGIIELIQDGKNGRLVEPGNVGAWADCIKKILEEPIILETWRDYALKHAIEFNHVKLADKLVQFISLGHLESSDF